MHTMKLHLGLLTEQQILGSSQIPREGENIGWVIGRSGSWSHILSLWAICSKNVSLGPA